MRQYDSYRASQPAYVHGSAAPDLRRQGNPDVNVMPGRRNGVNHAGVPRAFLAWWALYSPWRSLSRFLHALVYFFPRRA